MPTVLLIEDDSVIARVMATHLRHAGFEVQWADDGVQGLAELRRARPDVAVIDLMLPGLDGWAVTETARREGLSVPIIAVSARSAEHDTVHTLAIGADDYLAKPFGMRELVARVQALLRRSTKEAPAASAVIRLDGMRIDPNLRRAFIRVDPEAPDEDWPDAALTPTEFRLLLTLARQPGRALSREELQRRVWGTPHRYRDRTVDVCVRRLREKLDRRSPSHSYVQTHHGVGYRFAATPRDDGAAAAG
jgi:two-component system OmpR family response regulator/two-component system alkaline phosphatase synthesis response regulator PhoP